jgi:hypothetical protein
VVERSGVFVRLCECILDKLLKVNSVGVGFVKMPSESDDFVVEFCVVSS